MEEKDKKIEKLTKEIEEMRRLLEAKTITEVHPEFDKSEFMEKGRYRQAVVFSPNPLFTLDKDGRILFCNKSCEDLIGYQLSEVSGKRFGSRFLEGDSAKRLADAVTRVFRGEMCPRIQLEVRRKDGQIRHTLSRAYPIYSPDNKVEECAIANADITELKIAQQALEESEERYRALSDSSFEGIVITRDGIIIDANENLTAMSGYELAEVTGMRVTELIAKEHSSETLNNILADESKSYELTAVKKDGVMVPIEVRGKTIPYKGSSARVSAILDITERKRAEQALRDNEQRLQAIFESARDCIFIKDRDLRYLHVNPAMARLLGLPASSIIGRRSEEIFGQSAGRHIRAVETRVLNGESIEEEHTRPVNGEPMTFLDTLVPLRDSKGELYGICGISRDITERRRISPSLSDGSWKYLSAAMESVMEKAAHIAAREGIILLLGESGTGKDHLARWIHDRSRRSGNPFFSVNCAALPQDLAESELFGHESGAFTGAKNRKRGLLELAEGGTLLLNEIGELSPVLQAKLLSFLDTRSFLRVGGEKSVRVDARIIAATHRNLEKEVSEGRFLQPLYYRLNVFSITIPPLRERLEDIPVLVEAIVSKITSEMHMTETPVIDAAMIRDLSRYDWPGNVRELRNVLERALMLWDSGGLEPSVPIREALSGDWFFCVKSCPGKTLHELTEDFRRSLCLEMIRRLGNKKEAALALGISRDSIYRYINS
ncbi:sigma 54-interacting transcriptional regulator [Desulfomonile tiedjei]|uniref:PAS domain S-box n=1 Tax=Desulfomonile tiedjei (strain ATCC 49306 / DSM 6799 / DCB-1) TaxID=706587 RepID=I4C0Q2_DESTA|nr:sigma 54-interacting transcriptional regulator [Desulfomonile tiedjei]AFM23143.1 PAS domain S-box [Desulfomonile tiedjei DSM 6799]